MTPKPALLPRKFVIYHNPRCTKSREALDRLRKAGIEPKIVEYLKTPIPALELDKLLKQMKLLPQDIVRTTEDRFIDLELDKTPPKTRSGWVKLLADNPVLIERPIITDGTRAVLGRPLENVDKIVTPLS
ncbi:MAG: arsenate reductase (glutaredoxin) [Deltaproteobacteria bacterium]|nr:arsenate reductase (glutaredoxin) [Deltaproteobacteria bacterium]